ncbi:MAG: hypothetical protein E7029_07105 [Planctomycetaceae bacterium]|nr:hypothetical protein [Planctomycetaceae bacterium]
MPTFFNIFGRNNQEEKPTIPLVVALNKVDKFEPGDWDHKINQPSEDQKKNIETRCKTISRQIARTTGIPADQIVYYSALQYYRTECLILALILATKLGFKFNEFHYYDFIDKITDPEALAEVDKYYKEKYKGKDRKNTGKSLGHAFIEYLNSRLPKDQVSQFKKMYEQEMEKAPSVLLLGQTGVGKTQTVSALLGQDPEKLGVSHLDVGTTERHAYNLEANGAKLQLVDLPGYGVNEEEDAKYYELYKDSLKNADVVLLVIEATQGAFAQDEKMINNLITWMKEIGKC